MERLNNQGSTVVLLSLFVKLGRNGDRKSTVPRKEKAEVWILEVVGNERNGRGNIAMSNNIL